MAMWWVMTCACCPAKMTDLKVRTWHGCTCYQPDFFADNKTQVYKNCCTWKFIFTDHFCAKVIYYCYYLLQSNSAIMNSWGTTIFVHYIKVDLWFKMTNLTWKSIRFNRKFINNRVRYNQASLYYFSFVFICWSWEKVFKIR